MLRRQRGTPRTRTSAGRAASARPARCARAATRCRVRRKA